MRGWWCAVAAALVMAAGQADAQTLRGRVVEQGTQQPVADAALTLVDAAGAAVASARSDAAGDFELSVATPGEYQVKAQRLGYRALVSRAVFLGGDEPVSVEVRLTPAAVALDTALVALERREGIAGRVLDDAGGQPVAGATVTLLNSRGRRDGRAVTDSAGRFHLRVRVTESYQLQAERVGFRGATSQSFTVTPDDTVQVEMRLAADAVLLAPLTVVAAPRTLMRDHQLAAFEWRREKQPYGRYMGAEEIRRINPFYASDVLQQMPLVQVHGGFNRIVTLPVSIRTLGAPPRCIPNLYLDGVPVRLNGEALTIDQLVSGSSVAAVEVYDHPAQTPIEYPARDNPYCGVIVIWTRVRA